MSRTATAAPRRRRTLVRVATAIAALFTVWHLFASFLWIAPPTALREVPGSLLSSYMLPWYGQSWSVFAPEPINGDYTLKVRAIIVDENGAEKSTDWVSATDVEATMHTHNLFPPRAGSLAYKQATNLKGAWEKLTPEQKEIVELGFYKGDDWLGRLQLALNAAADNSNEQDVIDYIVAERYSDAYATQIADAIWGDDVVQVQYEASRQGIIPFAERHNPDAERPAPVVVPTGWRGLITLEGQSSDAFAEIFRSAYEGMDK